MNSNSLIDFSSLKLDASLDDSYNGPISMSSVLASSTILSTGNININAITPKTAIIIAIYKAKSLILFATCSGYIPSLLTSTFFGLIT